MTDVLAILDAAIEQVGVETRSASRSSREHVHNEPVTGAGKPLDGKDVPALPVVPAAQQQISDGISQPEIMLASHRKAREVAPKSILSKIAGTTGSTGTGQDFCAIDSSRNFIAHGNSGNFGPAVARDELAGSAAVPVVGGAVNNYAADRQNFFDERAAIAEFEAAIPRAWAKGFARLQTMPCPAGIHPERWQQVIDDAGRFLDRWAMKAAALGWDTASVFDYLEKSAERDCVGLVWLLHGREVMAIAADTARIGMRTSAPQLYYRRLRRRGVPLWKLGG